MNKKRGLFIQTLFDIAKVLKIDPASLLPNSEGKISKVSFEEYIRGIIRDEFKKLSKNKK